MKILICKNDEFGGANYLLERLYLWMKKNDYDVEKCIVCKKIYPIPGVYDLAVMPAYIHDEVYSLKKRNVEVRSVLMWIMGMGSFQDCYYNPQNTTGIKGVVTRIIAKESEKALRTITGLNSICFTDVVGRYNTYKNDVYVDELFENDKLIPIGISLSNKETHQMKSEKLRMCWVGRVSYDFKFIPLKKVLYDTNEYCKLHSIKAKFTVVGDGDASAEIKNILSKMDIETEYIPFIEYSALDDFFSIQDIAFVMGTSALDAARNNCPAVVVTPVRLGIDKELVYYRWIYESKGYSLGEYPGFDKSTNQIMKNLDEIMDEYLNNDDIPIMCRKYSEQFDENVVFKKLLNIPTKPINNRLKKHIFRFYVWHKFTRLYLKLKKIH